MHIDISRDFLPKPIIPGIEVIDPGHHLEYVDTLLRRFERSLPEIIPEVHHLNFMPFRLG